MVLKALLLSGIVSGFNLGSALFFDCIGEEVSKAWPKVSQIQWAGCESGHCAGFLHLVRTGAPVERLATELVIVSHYSLRRSPKFSAFLGDMVDKALLRAGSHMDLEFPLDVHAHVALTPVRKISEKNAEDFDHLYRYVNLGIFLRNPTVVANMLMRIDLVTRLAHLPALEAVYSSIVGHWNLHNGPDPVGVQEAALRALHRAAVTLSAQVEVLGWANLLTNQIKFELFRDEAVECRVLEIFVFYALKGDEAKTREAEVELRAVLGRNPEEEIFPGFERLFAEHALNVKLDAYSKMEFGSFLNHVDIEVLDEAWEQNQVMEVQVEIANLSPIPAMEPETPPSSGRRRRHIEVEVEDLDEDEEANRRVFRRLDFD